MITNLSLEKINHNFQALAFETKGKASKEQLSDLQAYEDGEIVRAGLFTNIFLRTIPVDKGLEITHTSYHYWRKITIENSIVPLQTYLKGCFQGIPTPSSNSIIDPVNGLNKFYKLTRSFFSDLPKIPLLKEIFKESFCADCAKNCFLFDSYVLVFKLQDLLGEELPFSTLSNVVKGWGGMEGLEAFIRKLQTKKIPTRDLHRGLVGFFHIYRNLEIQPEPVLNVGQLEKLMQDSALRLTTAQKITNIPLFTQFDSPHIRWRDNLKAGSEVTLREIVVEGEKNKWRRSKWILGNRIGQKAQGEEDRLIHFEVKSGTESVIPIEEEADRNFIEIMGDEEWVKIPHCENFVLTIGQNEAVLKIKRAIQESILYRKHKHETPFTQRETCVFNSAHLAPLLPLRLDIDGICALYPRLRPINSQEFLEGWVQELESLKATPKPLSLKYVMAGEMEIDEGIQTIAFYLKLVVDYPKDPSALEKIKKEISTKTTLA